jgi:hypothetical protein
MSTPLVVYNLLLVALKKRTGIVLQHVPSTRPSANWRQPADIGGTSEQILGEARQIYHTYADFPQLRIIPTQYVLADPGESGIVQPILSHPLR